MMNTRQNATQSILSFLRTDDQFLLLTGTHQYEKHVLVLSTIFSNYPAPATILFRASHSNNIQRDLSLVPELTLTKKPKPGDSIIHGEFILYVDTMNRRTWYSSPSGVDVAILYPIDALGYDEGDDCVQDLIRRKAKKIFLVSWTDSKNFGWTDQFNPIRVIFDAAEEDPEYHQRVLESVAFPSSREPISENLPQYAQSTSKEYLVKIYCRTCQRTRRARLNQKYPGKSALRNAEIYEYKATCLKCGEEAFDNYNWSR